LLRTETPPGFYGIVIKESDESFVTKDDTLIFNSSDFHVADVSGKPTVTIVDGGIDHGSLSGLSDDDHLQYLLINGTRAMTGDLNMGGQDVNNARTGNFSDIVRAEAFYVVTGGELNQLGARLKSNDFDLDLGYIPPSYGFLDDPDTGIRMAAADTLAFMVGGVDQVTLTPTQYSSIVPIAVPISSAATPSLQCGSDTDTGINFAAGAANRNTFQFVAGGTAVATVGRDGIRAEDKMEAEAFYLTRGGEVFAYDFNREHFYVTAAKTTIGRYVVNLDTDPGGSNASPVDVTDGLNEYIGVSEINFSNSDFYISSDLDGNPVVNIKKTRWNKTGYEFQNTNAEVDLLSFIVPANSLQDGNRLVVRHHGNIYNNAGTRTYRYRVYWGDLINPIYDSTTINIVATANVFRPLLIEQELFNSGSPDQQHLAGKVIQHGTAVPTVGNGTFSANHLLNDVFSSRVGAVNVNSAAAQAFKTTITPSAASSDYAFYLSSFAWIE